MICIAPKRQSPVSRAGLNKAGAPTLLPHAKGTPMTHLTRLGLAGLALAAGFVTITPGSVALAQEQNRGPHGLQVQRLRLTAGPCDRQGFLQGCRTRRFDRTGPGLKHDCADSRDRGGQFWLGGFGDHGPRHFGSERPGENHCRLQSDGDDGVDLSRGFWISMAISSR